ncbi:50S ribosomal protein L18 [Planctomycetota bacterium]|nr:50S ribosomal protein L18 [Planctomycetota bacterium]
MKAHKVKANQKKRRSFRVRNRIRATREQCIKPRLSVHRTARHISAQIIDDEKQVTLAYATTVGKENKTDGSGNVEGAKSIGKKIAEMAAAKGILEVAFDRGSFRYHGRVKALAEAAREGGLKF